MKKIYLLLVFLPLLAAAQPPAGYYNGALGQNGQPLRVSLYNIIKGHTELTYTPGLWNAYHTTDVKPNGKLWDIYSDVPGGTPAYQYTIGTNQCSGGSPTSEGGCYNREHLWPQSKFGSASPMQTDLWIVYPTDYYVNNRRGDLPYGKVSTATQTFSNGSKIGANVYAGAPAGNCFEPVDSFKGDIARSYFYVCTRYLADSNAFNAAAYEMANKINLKPWAVQMLLEWHHNDPVSKKEIDRNNAAYALQNNRNPFIDYPQFADCIWGTGDCSSLSVNGPASIAARTSIYPNPAHNEVKIDWVRLAPDEVLAIDAVNMQGQLLYHKNVAAGETQVAIETGNWAKGIYMLHIRTRSASEVQKLVVE